MGSQPTPTTGFQGEVWQLYSPGPVKGSAAAPFHRAPRQHRTWKFSRMSFMLPLTNSSRGSFRKGGPPTYRLCTSARLLTLLMSSQSQDEIWGARARGTEDQRGLRSDRQCPPQRALTTGPLALFRDFWARCVGCRALPLLCLAATHRLRWKLLSPEMAMCMLRVSKKRMREPWGEGQEDRGRFEGPAYQPLHWCQPTSPSSASPPITRPSSTEDSKSSCHACSCVSHHL